VLHLSRTTVPFAYVSQHSPSPVQAVFATNTGASALTITALSLEGAQPGDFAIAASGTCTAGLVLNAGERCRVDVQMIPNSPRNRSVSASVFLHSTATAGDAEIVLNGTVDPALTGPIFVVTPSFLDFPPQAIGTSAAPQTITIAAATSLAFVIEQFNVLGGDAADFTLSSPCHIGQGFSSAQPCVATITFTPQAAGPRSTELQASFGYGGLTGAYRFSVTGVGGGAAVPVSVVEYYNAVLDHYFITWVPAEQANLDAGNTPTRWTRTGYAFNAYTSAVAATSPVCRYYIPPLYGDSHFFGRGTSECDATGVAHPQFTLEDPAFMHVFLPVAGTCPAATTPIYRVFSNRADANHRYMTDRAVRDQMVARGWLAEGDGPDLVVMCGA
jgi:hypothetical protein